MAAAIGPAVGVQPVDQHREVDHDLAAARWPGRQPVQYLPEADGQRCEPLSIKLAGSHETSGKIRMQPEHGFVQDGRVIGFHPPKTGQQDLLEALRIEFSQGPLKQAAGDNSRCDTRLLAGPLSMKSQARGDLGNQLPDVAPPDGPPGPGILQQLPD